MRLTKMTSYALRILIHCGQHPDSAVKASEVAEAHQITAANVFKVVQLLTRASLLKTVRGPGGGLKLARPPGEISIGDIVRATEETHIQADCFGQGVQDCVIQQATPINRVFDTALDAFIDVLDAHTLEEFLRARPGTVLFQKLPRPADDPPRDAPVDEADAKRG